jgi:REP element-mobilizing transposase RayT
MSHEYPRPYNPDGVQAYFLTLRCYGTWLHGDPRGSVDRSGHHNWSAPRIQPDHRRRAHERELLDHAPASFDAQGRTVVDQAIRSVCTYSGWILHALNVQEGHAHVVVTAVSRTPEHVMNAFKSWATRRLREAGLIANEGKVWSRHGSTRWLWTEEQVGAACAYVIDGQPLPPEMGWEE